MVGTQNSSCEKVNIYFTKEDIREEKAPGGPLSPPLTHLSIWCLLPSMAPALRAKAGGG